MCGTQLRNITKTVKTFNVYSKDNPIYQKFATELSEKFNAFFESSDELKIDIEQYSLLYKESEVYRSEEKTIILYASFLRRAQTDYISKGYYVLRDKRFYRYSQVCHEIINE